MPLLVALPGRKPQRIANKLCLPAALEARVVIEPSTSPGHQKRPTALVAF